MNAAILSIVESHTSARGHAAEDRSRPRALLGRLAALAGSIFAPEGPVAMRGGNCEMYVRECERIANEVRTAMVEQADDPAALEAAALVLRLTDDLLVLDAHFHRTGEFPLPPTWHRLIGAMETGSQAPEPGSRTPSGADPRATHSD